jgi:tRNA dimethylallyltransferase
LNEKSIGLDPKAILIAGPTASGKSGLAIDLAEKWNGTIINADSMQVYPVLRVITARPSDEDLERVPHLLYGHASLDRPYSVAQWMNDAKRALDDVLAAGRTPIFVGGTGLYFKALIEGLANIPEVPPEIRSRWRQKLKESGVSALYMDLQKLDPLAANVLKPSDKQRILRALEVIEATGQSIIEYQSTNSPPMLEQLLLQKFLFVPDRAELHARIEKRFDKMVENGAIEEVMALQRCVISPDHPIMKTIGVPQLTNYLQSVVTLDEARERCKIATRQFAKRQSTWFRNQLDNSWVDIEKFVN